MTPYTALRFRWHKRFAVMVVLFTMFSALLQGCGGGGSSGNLQPPDNQQSAKDMVQMVRDVTSSARNAGFDMQGILDSAVDAQNALQRQIDTTTSFTSRVEHILRIMASLEGQPPGEYEYSYEYSWDNPYGGWRIYLIRSQPQGTEWRVTMYDLYDEPVALTIRSQNPLTALHLSPVAGKYTMQALAQQISYSGELEATWNPGSRDINFTLQRVSLRDPLLSNPVTFSGQGSAKLASDASGDKRIDVQEITFNGEFESPYGSVRAEQVKLVWNPHWNEGNSLVSLQAGSLGFSLSARQAQGELSTVNARLKRVGSANRLLALDTVAIGQMRLQTGTDNVELKNIQGQFVDYPDASAAEDTALSSLTAQITLRGLRGRYSGSFSARWDNPKPFAEWNGIERRIRTFPKGEVTFSGTFESLGVSLVEIREMRARLAPDAAPPAVTIVAKMVKGSQTIDAQWLSVLQQVGQVEIARSTLTATYQPSGIQLEVSLEGNRVRGTLTAQDGKRLGIIARARDVGIPDLGDVVVVKYSDGSFEALDSLWLGRR